MTFELTNSQRARLSGALARSVQLGLIGGPTSDVHVEHALVIADLARLGGASPSGRWLDLGSGGGIPGLAIAAAVGTVTMTLLEASQRRCTVLNEAVIQLGLTDRVDVVHARAEVAARTGIRGAVDVVVARSFGAPAVTAECAVGLLRVAGLLVVTEPPTEPGEAARSVTRWDLEGLSDLGFAEPRFERRESTTVAMMTKQRSDDRWPRGNGVPRKRPLW